MVGRTYFYSWNLRRLLNSITVCPSSLSYVNTHRESHFTV